MTGFDERYETLRGRFVTRCAADLPVLEAALAGPYDRELLRHTVHRMAGAGGTFGFPEIGRLAGAVDDRLMVGDAPHEAELGALVEAIRALSGP